MLFGTDWPDWTPRRYLADLQSAIPLTGREFDEITANRAPYISALGKTTREHPRATATTQQNSHASNPDSPDGQAD